jgi:hypothetical protein
MPVGLSPAAAPPTKSKSVEISASYPILSTFRFPIKAARTAAYFGQTLQSSHRIELNDATV